MRHIMTFGLALFTSLAIVDTADAKKPKKDETTEAPAEEKAAAEPMSLEIQTTGVADVDNLFGKAVDPLKTLRGAHESIDKMNTDLTSALGLAEGTPFADALADLKTKAEGKINVAVAEGGMPKLAASDAVPANVQASIDAINNGVAEANRMVGELSGLPDQMKEIAAAAAAISPKTLMSSGVKATEAPKIMKAITTNVKIVGSAPAELTGLTVALTNVTTTITSTFSN